MAVASFLQSELKATIAGNKRRGSGTFKDYVQNFTAASITDHCPDDATAGVALAGTGPQIDIGSKVLHQGPELADFERLCAIADRLLRQTIKKPTLSSGLRR